MDTAPDKPADQLVELLLSMSYADPQLRPLLDLEGLRVWEEGRSSGYGALDGAIEQAGFYDAEGGVTATGYTP